MDGQPTLARNGNGRIRHLRVLCNVHNLTTIIDEYPVSSKELPLRLRIWDKSNNCARNEVCFVRGCRSYLDEGENHSS